jgi:hypothetical protein
MALYSPIWAATSGVLSATVVEVGGGAVVAVVDGAVTVAGA